MDPTIRPLITFLRILAIFDAFTLLLALEWSGLTPSGSLVVYCVTQSAALFTFAFWPRRLYSSTTVRLVMLWFAPIAAITAFPLILQDMNSPIEPHWDAVKLRVLTWGLFLAMFLEAKTWKTAI
jgi:hypothetical protein